MPSLSAFTMLGEALGMSSIGPSTKPSTSGLFQAGSPCSRAATLAAASVACAHHTGRTLLPDAPQMHSSGATAYSGPPPYTSCN